MNPLASMPTTWSTRPRWRSAMSRTTAARAGPSASSGVKSLNATPGSGKSGMSRRWSETTCAIGWLSMLAIPASALALRRTLGLVARPGRHEGVDRAAGPGRTGGYGALDGPVRGLALDRARLRWRLGPAGLTLPGGLVPRGTLAQVHHGRLPLAQVGQQRRGDEDRGVRAGRDTDEQRQAQVEQRAGPEQHGADDQDRRHRQERDDRGVDGAHQGLVDREVGRLGVARPAAADGVLGVLANLVEDDHGVVERVTQDGQEADHRGRGDLEPEERVDADRDDHVVQERDEAGQRHLPGAEVERHREGHEDEEPDQGGDRLLAHRRAPGRTDERRRDLVLVDPEGLGQGALGLLGLGVVQLLGLDPNRVATDPGHDDVGAGCQVADRALGRGLEALCRAQPRDPELGPAAELQAQVEVAAEDADQCQDDDDAGDGVPGLLAADEVDLPLARVQVVAELREARHDGWLPSAAARRAAIVTRPRPAYMGCLAPRRSGSKPDHL